MQELGYIRLFAEHSASGAVYTRACLVFTQQPVKNCEYRRFIKNRAPTRRDEGEYPVWVFD
jgi:hypothetical protein